MFKPHKFEPSVLRAMSLQRHSNIPNIPTGVCILFTSSFGPRCWKMCLNACCIQVLSLSQVFFMQRRLDSPNIPMSSRLYPVSFGPRWVGRSSRPRRSGSPSPVMCPAPGASSTRSGRLWMWRNAFVLKGRRGREGLRKKREEERFEGNASYLLAKSCEKLLQIEK